MLTMFEIGDLVMLNDCLDPDRNLGIIVAIAPKLAHMKSHGTSAIVRVYWPKLDDADWEYDFFLTKIELDDLTEGDQ